MRLWHIDLIPYLPDSQLKAQWRELNSIFKDQPKHILINYVYDYPKATLYEYTMIVLDELKKRNIKVRSFLNFNKYFQMLDKSSIYFNDVIRFKEHNNEYLTICYWNLREKYIRKQKDFAEDIWLKLDKYYKDTIYNSYNRKTLDLLF